MPVYNNDCYKTTIYEQIPNSQYVPIILLSSLGRLIEHET
jgi:hypothetical protein